MRRTKNTLTGAINFFFFISGICALIYQIAWQRILFTAFGADMESATIIVSAFMLGLGAGAIAGGWLADHYPHRTLALFALAEGGVGMFGLVSPELMRIVGDSTIHSSLAGIAAANFALILAPTLLMGATLPILVTDLARRWSNIGFATGLLYSTNTLGATFGALLTGFVLFYWFPLDTVIFFAAVGNFFVASGVTALVLWTGSHSESTS
jgi:predicted membrane-bound spermidine synthase